MKREIEVSREWVAEALEKESKLLAGRGWIALWASSVHRQDCAVCAVGAVMRRALSPDYGGNFAIDDTAELNAVEGRLCIVGTDRYYSVEDIFDAASEGGVAFPMNALSFVFESLGEYHRQGNATLLEIADAVRRDAIRFVRDYFPERVRLKINGYEPAQDAGVTLIAVTP